MSIFNAVGVEPSESFSSPAKRSDRNRPPPLSHYQVLKNALTGSDPGIYGIQFASTNTNPVLLVSSMSNTSEESRLTAKILANPTMIEIEDKRLNSSRDYLPISLLLVYSGTYQLANDLVIIAGRTTISKGHWNLLELTIDIVKAIDANIMILLGGPIGVEVPYSTAKYRILNDALYVAYCGGLNDFIDFHYVILSAGEYELDNNVSLWTGMKDVGFISEFSLQNSGCGHQAYFVAIRTNSTDPTKNCVVSGGADFAGPWEINGNCVGDSAIAVAILSQPYCESLSYSYVRDLNAADWMGENSSVSLLSKLLFPSLGLIVLLAILGACWLLYHKFKGVRRSDDVAGQQDSAR